MTTPSDPAAAAALAAAVAAAAEIAKSSSLFYSEGAPRAQQTTSKDNDAPSFRTGTMNAKRFAKQSKEVDDEEVERRLARSRERNREHARRTRLRKKAQLEALQARVTELEDEARVLKQSIEECSIASILVGLSSGNQQAATDPLLDVTQVAHSTPKVTRVGKRKRFVLEDGAEQVPQPLKLILDGKMTLIGGGKSHINWKSGVYYDEHGKNRQLTHEQLESLRRERNRMHAKMTRDRKRSFIQSIEKTIHRFEAENQRKRHILNKVAEMVGTNTVTPSESPKLAPSITPDIHEECDTDGLASKLSQHVSNVFHLTTA